VAKFNSDCDIIYLFNLGRVASRCENCVDDDDMLRVWKNQDLWHGTAWRKGNDSEQGSVRKKIIERGT